jgi:two-component system, LuxR family, response regulator FixJ
MNSHCELSFPRPTVVVVDDDPAVSNSLKFALEIEGFSVHLYSSGSDLLTAAQLPAQGCLIIDHKMPGMTGLDLLAELRRSGVTLPALLITTYPSPVLFIKAAQAGVAIIEKPLLGEALLDGIHRALATPQPQL